MSNHDLWDRAVVAGVAVGLVTVSCPGIALAADSWSPQASVGAHARLTGEKPAPARLLTGGLWRANVHYAADSVVRYQGAAWIARRDNSGHRPKAGSAVWKLLVKDGANGKNGINGRDGTNGENGTNGKDGANGAAGAQGPVGPVGPVGPKGEAGTPGLITTDPLLGPSSHAVAANATVIFDSIVYSKGAISYNPATGVVTLNDTGVFTVQFGVATDGFIGTPSPKKAMGFRLVSSQGDDCGAWSAISSGTVGRTCIIDVAVAPVTLSLANSTDNTINLADVTGTQAWLTASNEETPRIAMQVELRS